jgi:hypothetical protein
MNKIMHEKEKKSQITIFVIIAILIIAAIALVFLISNKTGSQTNVSPVKDPIGFIQKCAIDAVQESEKIIIPSGGLDRLDSSNSILFENTKVAWMCYTPFNEQTCTARHPMLNKEIEREIENYIRPKLVSCFNTLKDNLGKYDYNQEDLMNLSVEIRPKQIYIILNREISFTKNEQTTKIINFNTWIDSPLYSFIKLTNNIVNQEVSCKCMEETCNADIFSLNKNNKDFEIKRFVSGANEKVYTITEILSDKKFNFAVRNCVRLP